MRVDPFPYYTVAKFRYHLLLKPKRGGLWARLAIFVLYFSIGRRIYRERPFDCIVTYGFSLTALAVKTSLVPVSHFRAMQKYPPSQGKRIWRTWRTQRGR